MTKRPEVRRLLRTLVIELLVYSVLLALYYLFVLRVLGQPLLHLLENHLTLYALAALGLVIAQGAVLDTITSFLVRLVRLDRFD